jgi:hypothetical protein
MGVEAFGIYGSVSAIGVLLDILKSSDPPPYLRDEVVLALASILDIQNLFYPVLVRFLEDPGLAPTLAADQGEAAFEFYKSSLSRRRDHGDPRFVRIADHAKNIQAVIGAFARDGDGRPLSRWILGIPGKYSDPVVQTILAETVLEEELCGLPRLQLLISFWAAHSLRRWIKQEDI